MSPAHRMSRSLHDAFLVCCFDIRESLKSRKAVLLSLIYLGGAMAFAALFVFVLREMAWSVTGTGDSTSGQGAAIPGGSSQFHDILLRLFNNSELADGISQVPPLALLYGWLAFTFVPFLAILASASSVSTELASGSCRFVLVRVDRFAWTLGKLAAQALVLAMGIVLGALGVLLVAYAGMPESEIIYSAPWLATMALRAWFFGFAYIGLALGISQVVPSPWASTGLGLLVLIGMSVLAHVLGNDWVQLQTAPVGFWLYQLLPQAHRIDLMLPALPDRLVASTWLLGLGFLYHFMGFLAVRRWDA